MRENENGSKAELKERRQQVPEPRTEERPAARAREAGVVGDERHPRHRERDHEVDTEPEGAAVPAARPQTADVAVAQDPHREVEDRRCDGPDADVAREPTPEAAGTHKREREAERTEDQLPHPDELDLEDAVAECSRGH